MSFRRSGAVGGAGVRTRTLPAVWHDRDMENWLGPIDQLGYVVDDIEGAMGHWIERLGVGPFYLLKSPPMKGLTYRGQPTGARIDVALAFSGSLQVELIAPLDDEPTVDSWAPPHPSSRTTSRSQVPCWAQEMKAREAWACWATLASSSALQK